MIPNRRERLVERALGWARVRTRPGKFVKAFGWSSSVITYDEKATTSVFEALRGFGEVSKLDMFVRPGGRSARSISSMQPSEFRAAVDERNELDAGLGGAHIRSTGGEISIVIDWVMDANAPRTTVMTTIEERWLDEQSNVDLLTVCLAAVATSAHHEYQLISHISDEARKLGPGRRFENSPGAGIPFVPWWLMLGPNYVAAVGRDALSRLSAEIVSWIDGFASLRTSASPLLYGTDETIRREEEIRDALGGAFLDSAGASSIRPPYPIGYTAGPPRTGEIWDAYARDGKVTVVARKETVRRPSTKA